MPAQVDQPRLSRVSSSPPGPSCRLELVVSLGNAPDEPPKVGASSLLEFEGNLSSLSLVPWKERHPNAELRGPEHFSPIWARFLSPNLPPARAPSSPGKKPRSRRPVGPQLSSTQLASQAHAIQRGKAENFPSGFLLGDLYQTLRLNWFRTHVGKDSHHLFLPKPNRLLVQPSRSVASDSLQPHGLQHVRPPCPSPTPGVYSLMSI